MNQGKITEEQYKDLLGSFTQEAGSTSSPVSGFAVSKEKKEQAKKFLMMAEQSLGGESRPKKRPKRKQGSTKQRKSARPVEKRLTKGDQDLRTLLHESIEMVASGSSPEEMALFLMEGPDSD